MKIQLLFVVILIFYICSQRYNFVLQRYGDGDTMDSKFRKTTHAVIQS